MQLQQIDVIAVQALQAGFDGSDHMRTPETNLILTRARENAPLGRNEHLNFIEG